jgi:hydroxylamine reductase
MSMFCYQCQETAGGRGCTVRGVCGKTEEVAKLQDLLIYTLKGISGIVVKGKLDVKDLGNTNYEVLNSLFMTITNANFDDNSIEKQILKMIAVRDELRKAVNVEKLHDAATFTVDSRASMLEKASSVGVLSTEDEDVRSLCEMITYGVKGMAAYAEHAKNIGKEDLTINAFIYEALAATLDDSLTADDLVALTLKTGEYGVKVMALLDEANTSRFGNPEITEVNIGVRKNPAIYTVPHNATSTFNMCRSLCHIL